MESPRFADNRARGLHASKERDHLNTRNLDRHKFEEYRIQILFNRSSANQYAGMVTASVYAAWSYWNAPNQTLWWAGWWIAYMGGFALRISIHQRYFYLIKKNRKPEPFVFENWLAFGNFITGCFWAVASAHLFPEAHFESVVFLSFILAGNTAGAAVGYCASSRSTAAFVFPALIPLMLLLFADGRDFLWHMAWLLALYVLVNTLLFRSLHKHIIDTIRLRFEKDRLVQEVLEAQKKAVYAEKMAALGEMSGGIAHEINNPLAIIQLANDQIQQKLRAEKVDIEFIQKLSLRIGNTVQRVSRIVESLRLFSRDGSGDAYGLFQASKLVEDTVVLCGEKFKSSNVKLTLESQRSDVQIYGNQVQLSQVLLNLLNNALDAVKGLEGGHVRVLWSQTDEHVEIKVQDNGSGIAPEIASKIFQPFFSTKQVGHGTGLGLSISLGIMQSHDGQLFFENTSPGTCFVMRLKRFDPGAA